VTGFTPIVGSLGGKWVAVLRDIAPRLSRVTLVFNPPTAPFVEDYLNTFRAAAASLGVDAIVGPVNDMSGLESLFTTQAREPNSGFVVIPDVFTIGHCAEIISLAAHWRVPAIYWSRSFTEIGGLISYGPYIPDEYRRATSYVDRILKGAKPSELPVQAPTKFELVINLKTAKAIGLDVPQSLLATANDLIE
jgi:putative ABC transport system substrate-binding protein